MSTQVVLLATRGELAGRRFVLQGPAQWRIGRSRSCSLRLPEDVTVSRHHCLLDVEPQAVLVQDLGSLNGTFVNGANIGQGPSRPDDGATMRFAPPHHLATGDELRVGRSLFRIQMLEAKEADEAKDGDGNEHRTRARCG